MAEQGTAWEDVVVPAGKWKELAQQYGLNDRQIRALNNRHNMPHIIEGKESLAMKFVLPKRSGEKLTTHWLNVYLDGEKIITFHDEHTEAANTLAERIEIHEVLRTTPSGVLSLIADMVTEQFTPILDYVDDMTDELVDVIAKQPSEDQLQQLFYHKRLLSDLRRVALPTVMLLDGLQNGRYQLVDKEYANTYLRDSYTYAWRVHELIDTARDLLTSALDVYMSVVSNRLNDVMKRLTMVATIFMPISFVVGFGGMNFIGIIPFDSSLAFGAILLTLVLLPTGMMLYYKRKGWL